MALAKCIFCGKEGEDFYGTYLIKNDGTMNYYCSSKCNKNHLKLGRDKRKLKWTNAFYESREKRYAAEKKAHAAASAAPASAVKAKK
jgi:large subunit ribosomal protein L24e